jgi:hypothetical protein
MNIRYVSCASVSNAKIRNTILCYDIEICAPLGYYATQSGNFVPTFLDNLLVQSSRVLDFLNLHHGGSLWPWYGLVSNTYTLLKLLPYRTRKVSASNHRLENSILLEVESRQQREEILRVQNSFTRPKDCTPWHSATYVTWRRKGKRM